MKRKPANHKNYMSIVVSVVREQQSSATTFAVCEQDNARKFPTAYSFERWEALYETHRFTK